MEYESNCIKRIPMKNLKHMLSRKQMTDLLKFSSVIFPFMFVSVIISSDVIDMSVIFIRFLLFPHVFVCCVSKIL